MIAECNIGNSQNFVSNSSILDGGKNESKHNREIRIRITLLIFTLLYLLFKKSCKWADDEKIMTIISPPLPSLNHRQLKNAHQGIN